MILKKSNIFDSSTNFTTLRQLIDSAKKKYLCDKAGSRLTDKYKTDFTEDSIEKKRLSSAQQAIVDFARDSSYDNIKPYLKRVAIFLAFIVLAIVLLIFWISYCCCCCCSCCIFGDAKPNRCCACISLFTAIICNFLVFLFSIIVLAIIGPFFKRLNGIGCSTLYFLGHVNNGLAPDYSNRAREWDGLEGLISKVYSIQSQKNTLNSVFTDIDNLPNDTGECKPEYDALKSNSIDLKDLLDKSFNNLIESTAIEDLEGVRDDINSAEDDVEDNLYDSMHDHANKYAIRISKAIFALTLIFSFLGLAILIIFIFFKNTCLKIAYVIIWNISMLLMFLAIVESAVFGIIGYIFKDAVQIANYILSEENLNSEDPLVFDNNNYYYDGYYDYNYGNSNKNYISNIIEICANGDGNFTNVIEGGQTLYAKLEDWKKQRSEIIKSRNSITCQDGDRLKNYYNELINLVDQSLEMTYNITNVTCSFAKNDKNILLNEADSGGDHGVALAGLGFLVGILLGISVFAGILFVHKFFSTWNEKKRINNVMNESSSNIGQENNNITTNPNNNMIPYPNNTMPYPNNNMMPYPNNNMTPYPNNNFK
jgi:hypothetical protein